MSSVAGSGSGAGFSVRVGNTLMKEPEKEVTPPEEVQPYKSVPSYEVDRPPSKKTDCQTAYPKEAEELGIEGKVILEIQVLASGKVGTVKVVKGLGHGLDEAASKALKRCRFNPAIMNGEPVTTRIRYTYRWTLDY